METYYEEREGENIFTKLLKCKKSRQRIPTISKKMGYNSVYRFCVQLGKTPPFLDRVCLHGFTLLSSCTSTISFPAGSIQHFFSLLPNSNMSVSLLLSYLVFSSLCITTNTVKKYCGISVKNKCSPNSLKFFKNACSIFLAHHYLD